MQGTSDRRPFRILQQLGIGGIETLFFSKPCEAYRLGDCINRCAVLLLLRLQMYLSMYHADGTIYAKWIMLSSKQNKEIEGF
jgi:hypothetical protein